MILPEIIYKNEKKGFLHVADSGIQKLTKYRLNAYIVEGSNDFEILYTNTDSGKQLSKKEIIKILTDNEL